MATDSANAWIARQNEVNFNFYFNPVAHSNQPLEFFAQTYEKFVQDQIQANAQHITTKFDIQFQLVSLTIRGQTYQRNQLNQVSLTEVVKPGEIFTA